MLTNFLADDVFRLGKEAFECQCRFHRNCDLSKRISEGGMEKLTASSAVSMLRAIIEITDLSYDSNTLLVTLSPFKRSVLFRFGKSAALA